MWTSPVTFRIYFMGVVKNKMFEKRMGGDKLKVARRGNSPVDF